MKQRLLLALLMLLTSAGFMKVEGEIQITLPKTEEAKDVKITFTSSEKKFVGSGSVSYPVISDNVPVVSSDGATATYAFKTSVDEPSTLILATAYPTDKSWGNVEITVDGPVSAFTVGALDATLTYDDIKATNPLLEHITALSFTGNNKTLTALKLGNYSDNLNYLPNLTTFSCTDHALTTIPFKSETVTSYNIGTVYPKAEIKGGRANNFKFAVANLNFTGITSNLININDLTITNLRDKDGNALTEAVTVSQPENVANGYWVFKNASGIYMDGTYTADIEVASTNKSYPGLVFANIT